MSRAARFGSCTHLYDTSHCPVQNVTVPPGFLVRLPRRRPSPLSRATTVVVFRMSRKQNQAASGVSHSARHSEGLPCCCLFQELFPSVAAWHFMSTPRVFIHFPVSETHVVPVWGCGDLSIVGRLSLPFSKYPGENCWFVG